MRYKKCPRCDINYIPENEDYCEICKQELKGDIRYREEDLESEDFIEELCPKCKVNYVADGEKYCEACLAEMALKAAQAKLEVPDWDEAEISDDEAEIVDDLGIEEPILDDKEELSLDELAEKEGWEKDVDDEEEEEEEEEEEIAPLDDDDFEEIDLDDPALDLDDEDDLDLEDEDSDVDDDR